MTWLCSDSSYRLVPRSASSLLLRRAVRRTAHAEGPEPYRPGAGHGEPTGALAIEVDIGQETTTVFISGELDLVTASFLAGQLAQVARGKPGRLVLDVAGTTFMDCGSARVIAATARARPAGRRLVIRSPRPGVRRILELTGLEAECEIEG